MGNIFLDLVLFIYNTIGFHNLGVAIVEIAVLTRVIFYPFLRQQAHYTKKMSELQPHIKALKEKHGDNKQAFATAQMELFKQHGVNPAAGCLPSVVQLVVLFGLYGALYAALKQNLNLNFLAWNMGQPDRFSVAGIPFPLPGLLVVLAAGTQFIQTKMMMPIQPAKPPAAKASEGQGKEFMEEFAEAQSSMIWLFPLMFLFLGTQWPSGLALYWSVSSVLAIIQQYQVTGLGGLEQYIVKLKQYGTRH
ncbi:MAG: YidC/Oxa1 family membrane protein insertase [Patescibacteria group bacterium]|nr:YidC/Oxa1 family membrane protein insertase [Patescibacteria group bacterium]MCL5431658.1 YidC/Oxa1 family membrane protein insertase [Patescibacteria group bacterium]